MIQLGGKKKMVFFFSFFHFLYIVLIPVLKNGLNSEFNWPEASLATWHLTSEFSPVPEETTDPVMLILILKQVWIHPLMLTLYKRAATEHMRTRHDKTGLDEAGRQASRREEIGKERWKSPFAHQRPGSSAAASDTAAASCRGSRCWAERTLRPQVQPRSLSSAPASPDAKTSVLGTPRELLLLERKRDGLKKCHKSNSTRCAANAF